MPTVNREGPVMRMNRCRNRTTRPMILAVMLLIALGTAAAQDEPVSVDDRMGGDEDPGANASDEEVQESAEDYYAEPQESTPAPGALLVLAGVAAAAAVASFTRRPRS